MRRLGRGKNCVRSSRGQPGSSVLGWEKRSVVDGNRDAPTCDPGMARGEALRDRVRQFAVRVLKFVRSLPRDPAAETVARQLARSGTGLSSNYHATGRARSRAEFVARLGVVVAEADESVQWLFVVRESGIAS